MSAKSKGSKKRKSDTDVSSGKDAKKSAASSEIDSNITSSDGLTSGRDYSKVKVLKGHKRTICQIRLHPNGQLVSTSDDKTIRFWNTESSKCEKIWQANKYGKLLAILPDGRIANTAVTDYYDCGVYFYDVDTENGAGGLIPKELYHMCSISIMENGNVLTTSQFNLIQMWDPVATKFCLPLKVFGEGRRNWLHIAIDLKNGKIASGSMDTKSLCIWNIETGECEKMLEHPSWVRDLVLLPNGHVVSECDSSLHIWNIETSECLRVLSGHTEAVFSPCLMPDGRLVTGSKDGTIRIWNVDSGECEQVLDNGGVSVWAVVCLPDNRIVSGDMKGVIKIWG